MYEGLQFINKWINIEQEVGDIVIEKSAVCRVYF